MSSRQVVRTGSREVLASDAARERSARALHGHYADGRLELAELDERVDRVHAARTRSELAAAMAGLPSDRRRRAWLAMGRFNRLLLRAHGTGFALLNGSLIAVWALTGKGSFWPAVVLAPTSMMLAAHVGWTWAVRRSGR